MNNSIEETLNSFSKKIGEVELIHKINNLIISLFYKEIIDISFNNKISPRGIRVTSNGIKNTSGIIHLKYYSSILEAFKAYKIAIANYLKNNIEEENKYRIEWQVWPRVRKYDRGYIAYGVLNYKRSDITFVLFCMINSTFFSND